MKQRKRFVLIASIMALSILACQVAGIGLGDDTTISGSGNVVTQEYDLTGFENVDISHSFNVDITQGESFSVIVRVDDKLVEELNVVKQGSTLKIGLKPNRDYTIRNATMETEVIMPELSGVEASGSSDATITGFKTTKTLLVDLSGGSTLQGDIESGDASFDLSGSSDAVLTGSAGDATIDASGSSDVDLTGFPVGNATVDASGSSTVTVNVSGRLDANASGGSDVFYLGNPKLGNVETSGSSSVEPK